MLDVAITLTVQTQLKDPITTVPDRNQGVAERVAAQRVQRLAARKRWNFNRVQPIPPTVTALLP